MDDLVKFFEAAGFLGGPRMSDLFAWTAFVSTDSRSWGRGENTPKFRKGPMEMSYGFLPLLRSLP